MILLSLGVLASFEEFLKQLPVDCEMAYEFKAFAGGRKVKTPGELLQLVMLYCGLDMSLRGLEWRRMDQPRAATPWRFLKTIRGQVDTCIREAHRWQRENWPACFEVVKERPRRRNLQTLPAQVVRLMEAYQGGGAARLAA